MAWWHVPGAKPSIQKYVMISMGILILGMAFAVAYSMVQAKVLLTIGVPVWAVGLILFVHSLYLRDVKHRQPKDWF